MKKVLIITYDFPPIGGIDSIYISRYVKHLPALGWIPYVLTTKPENRVCKALDQSLLAKIDKEVQVTRTNSTYFYDLLKNPPFTKLDNFLNKICSQFPPDGQIGWLPFGYLKGLDLIRREKIDIIYSFSTYTAHLIALLLKKRTHIPWVAHFADEWTQNPSRKLLFNWLKGVDVWMETKVLDAADYILVAWQGMTSLFQKDITPKSVMFPCGFDSDDFTDIATFNGHRFNITYTGSFYGPQQPTFFLHAIKDLIEDGKIDVDKIELNFFGLTRQLGFLDFEDNIVKKIIKRHGYLPHEEIISSIKSANVLLLILGPKRGIYTIPGKTFEYIASGKPILALAPKNSDMASLIRKTKTGVIADPEDIDEIKKAILSYYKKWEEKRLNVEPNWEEIYKYEAKVGVQKLSEILEKALNSKSKIQNR